MKIVVSATVRPPGHPFYGDSWERGLDPFHVNAFQGFSDDIKDQIRSIAPGPQKGGWFLLDAYGQEIGFVPDGTVITCLDSPNGTVCAMCKGSGAEFPGNPRTEKCEECDGTGKAKS